MNTLKRPCIRNCCLDQNDICIGCKLSLNEILNWHTFPEEVKQEIIQRSLKKQPKLEKI